MNGALCYVYVISIDDLGLTKIGVSNSPGGRLSQLATASPFAMRLAMSLEVPSRDFALELERAFHRVQRKYRRSGEWFSLTALQATALMAINYACALRYKAQLSDDEIELVFDMSGIGDQSCVLALQPSDRNLQ